MKTMAISDLLPQEQQVQDQPYSSTIVLPPTQDEEQVHHDDGMDQGEHKNKKEGRRKEYHRNLQLKSAPTFKEIIWWIKYLVTLVRD
jgi:hypothetical protein